MVIDYDEYYFMLIILIFAIARLPYVHCQWSTSSSIFLIKNLTCLIIRVYNKKNILFTAQSAEHRAAQFTASQERICTAYRAYKNI